MKITHKDYPDHLFQAIPQPDPFTLSVTASKDRCHRCQGAIWSVICRTGFSRRLDPTLLTIGEQLAHLGQRPTFRIWRTGSGFEVESRSLGDIIRTKGQGLILVAHDCTLSAYCHDWPDYWARPISPKTESEGFPY